MRYPFEHPTQHFWRQWCVCNLCKESKSSEQVCWVGCSTKGAFEMRRSIGGRCKCSNVFSRTVLIRREAWLTLFLITQQSICIAHIKPCKMKSWERVFACIFNFVLTRFSSGGYSDGETPLPIPNRVVKPVCANGTALFEGGRVGRRQGFFEEGHVL